MHLGLLDRAIEDINSAIAGLDNPDQLKLAWNNKGFILMRMNGKMRLNALVTL